MPDDTSIPDIARLLRAAENNLDLAERHFDMGDNEAASSLLEKIAEDLLYAGSNIISSIAKTDVLKFDGNLPDMLRALAERSGFLPENFAQVLSAVPKASEIISEENLQQAKQRLNVSGIVNIVKEIYDTDLLEKDISEDEQTEYLSSIETLIAVLKGQRTVNDAVFLEGGAYDAFCTAVSPYLVMGALFTANDTENAAEIEEKIPMLLHGPIKRLIMLLTALLTSAFMSGLLLLLLKRILAFRKLRPGILDNAMFAGSVLTLVFTNIPLFIEGLRAAVTELRKLQEIIDTKNGGTDISVVE